MDEKVVLPEDLHIESIILSGKDSIGREYKTNATICLEDKQGYINYNGFTHDDGVRNIIHGNITHYKCHQCGKVFPKKEVDYYSDKICNDCRTKNKNELNNKKYMELEINTENKYPVALYDNDKFFYDEDDLIDFLYDYCDTNHNESEFINDVKKVQLVATEFISAPTINLLEILNEDDKYFLDDDYFIDRLGKDSSGHTVHDLMNLINNSLEEMYANGGQVYRIIDKRINITKILDMKELERGFIINNSDRYDL
jgi:hypothetical protein